MTDAQRLAVFADATRLAATAHVPIELACIVARVSQRALVSIDDIRGPRRIPRYVNVRRVITRQARERHFSYPQIGQALHRDHTTVIRLLNPRGQA